MHGSYGCGYRSICREALDELKNDGFQNQDLINRLEFSLTYGGNTSQCGSDTPNCQLYRANRRISRLRIGRQRRIKLLKDFLQKP